MIGENLWDNHFLSFLMNSQDNHEFFMFSLFNVVFSDLHLKEMTLFSDLVDCLFVEDLDVASSPSVTKAVLGLPREDQKYE